MSFYEAEGVIESAKKPAMQPNDEKQRLTVVAVRYEINGSAGHGHWRKYSHLSLARFDLGRAAGIATLSQAASLRR